MHPFNDEALTYFKFIERKAILSAGMDVRHLVVYENGVATAFARVCVDT